MESTDILDQNRLQEIKNRVEATLFASGDKMTVEQLAKMARVSDTEYVMQSLRLLEKEYNEKDSSIHLVNDNETWKFNVRSKYINIAKRMGVKAELSKTIIETLAIVAWKSPVKQSDLIAIRTNKAYDHLEELEKSGFITRKKHGRTKLITLGKQFFEYFEIDEGMMAKMIERAAKHAEQMEVAKKEEVQDEVDTPSVEAEKPLDEK